MLPARGVDVDAFIADGFVRVPGAVPRSLAERIARTAASLVRELPDSAWVLGQASVYDLSSLTEVPTVVVRAAFDALAGPGNWHLAANWGFPTRGAGPSPSIWHIDGDWFTHHVTSAEQVLTPIFLWSDVGPRDGPTLLARGSHRAVARILAAHEPVGVPGDRVAHVIHEGIDVDHIEPATGAAGDLIVCHPFLAHAVNPVGSPRPRFISNVAVHGRRPLRIDPTDPSLTPIERPVADALHRT